MATQPSDYTAFPAEIVAAPTPLVGLSGLDAVNNAVHRAVWDAFAADRRADRTPLRFRLLSNTLEFPVVKPERTSYEWYLPRGLLKRNWIAKRAELVPALVVVFYDMEWDDPQADEKLIECASRVRSVRAALAGHATRLAVTVLQARPGGEPRPGGEAERAQALCAACDLPPRALFVLPHGERLLPYALRLEAAFLDIALAYYHHEAKAIKQHRDRLDKVAHRYLLVRHQFKLGYLAEVRRDLGAAHKCYRRAYDELLEVRHSDANANELRTVAGYIGYKLCRLLFALSLPRDAISQHKSHTERFEGRAGTSELLFEHYAWLARQHAAFGELFHEAVRAGLPAVRSHHPGYYYRRAAHYTAKRRQAMRAACADAETYPPGPDPLEGVADFYGQRPWRPDAARERAAVRALQHNERRFPHSATVISFLGSAVAQFKTFHSPRTRRRLVVEMADEYYESADYGKALTLLAHTLWDYRRERWGALASHVLLRALRCAFLAADVRRYVQLAAEALETRTEAAGDRKRRIYANLLAVMDAQPPEPEPDAPPEHAAAALDAWRTLPEPGDLTVDVADGCGFIEIRPKFCQPKYSVDDNVTIELSARLLYGTVLRATKVTATVCGARGSRELSVWDEGEREAGRDGVELRAGAATVLRASYRPEPQDAGTQLSVKSVSFMIEMKRKIYLNFKMDESAETGSHPELLHFMSSGRERSSSGTMRPTVAQITPRECRVEVSFCNAAPALQGEWFRTELLVTNREAHELCGLRVALTALPAAHAGDVDPELELRLDPAVSCAAPALLCYERLRPADTRSDAFYLRCGRPGTAAVRARVCHRPDAAGPERVEDFLTDVPVVAPFRVTTEFVDLNFEPTATCHADETSVLVPRLEATSPLALVIEETALEPGEGCGAAGGARLAAGGAVWDAWAVRAGRGGRYAVRWRREGGAAARSEWPVGAAACGEAAARARASWPARVVARRALELRVRVWSATPTPTRVRVTAEGSAAFLVAGYRSVSAWAARDKPASLRFRLYPLAAGLARPPRLSVTAMDAGAGAAQEVFRETSPGYIFVMPE